MDAETEFRALFDRNFADLWRFARRRCASASDADDIVAETFGTAWRRRGDVPGGPAARLWLFGVARNVLRNQRRTESRSGRVQLRLVSESESVHAVEVPPDVGAALGALGEDELDLVRMRYWDDFSVADIGALLGVTPNAVSIRLHRIRRGLRAQLDRKGSSDVG